MTRNEIDLIVEQKTGQTLFDWSEEAEKVMVGLSRIDCELNSEVIRILKRRVQSIQENLILKLVEN